MSGFLSPVVGDEHNTEKVADVRVIVLQVRLCHSEPRLKLTTILETLTMRRITSLAM